MVPQQIISKVGPLKFNAFRTRIEIGKNKTKIEFNNNILEVNGWCCMINEPTEKSNYPLVDRVL